MGGYLNQEWTVYLGAGQVGNGNYANVGFKNAYSGMWLDNPQSSQSNGTPTIQWPLDYGANQQWTLLAANASLPSYTAYIFNTATGSPLLGEYTAWTFVPLADNYFLFVNASTGEVLDDPDFSTSNGAGIQQYQLNGGLNQQWSIGDAGSVDGVEAGNVISNAYSTLMLDGPTGNSTSLIQDQFNPSSLTQCWQISTSWPYPAY